ncbi:hypothetical protein XENOCAPTIV_025334, partial [Xenoophorus captivus]
SDRITSASKDLDSNPKRSHCGFITGRWPRFGSTLQAERGSKGMALCGAKITQFLGANLYSEAPDGGWGWVISVAFFLVETFTYGIIKSFGIFLQDMMEEFGETNSRVSWIISICVFIMTFNGLGYCLTFLPTVTILSKYFSRRRSLVIALASTGESFAMFALAPVDYLCLSAFSVLRDKIGWRHTMAVIGALQSVIIICGALLRPIIIKPRARQSTEMDPFSPKELEALKTQENADCLVLENLEMKNSELSRGSVSTSDSGVQSLKDSSTPEHNILLHKEANLVTGPNFLEKDKEPEKEKHNKDEEKSVDKEEGDKKLSAENSILLDFSILRECSFILYSLFGLFATLGFFAPPLYIIELSVNRGVAREQATYMLSTIAVAEILGRFSIGWVLSREVFRKRKLLVLLMCVIMITVDLVGFTLVREFYGLAVCCGLYGFFMGALACTHIPMLAEEEVVGVERMSSAAGVYVFIQSFAGLGGPPLGGRKDLFIG